MRMAWVAMRVTSRVSRGGLWFGGEVRVVQALWVQWVSCVLLVFTKKNTPMWLFLFRNFTGFSPFS